MALFIEVKVDAALASDPDAAAKLAEVCPVNIFEHAPERGLTVVDENVDECTLCQLCLGIGQPGQVQILKLYDERQPLERSA